MIRPKLKKGTYVEIVEAYDEKYTGYRFTLGNYKVASSHHPITKVVMKDKEVMWEAGITSCYGAKFISESKLKPVNPDTDKESCMSFTELLGSLGIKEIEGIGHEG